MTDGRERAALVALLRRGGLHGTGRALEIEQRGGPHATLRAELHAASEQISLFPPGENAVSDSKTANRANSTADAPSLERLIANAQAEIEGWRAAGIRPVTTLDPDYPLNLRTVHDRPPIIFVAGDLRPSDDRAVAVIGSRRASRDGTGRAAGLSRDLVEAGYTVVSGLAAGIDAAAHRAALAAGGRTVAVIGTGLEQAYPPQHARLQSEIAARCAVISQFWPEAGPTRESFPLRNGLMSGLTRATVVVEASIRSGSRIQARLALAHGRPVFLIETLLGQAWARELASRHDVHVVASASEILTTVARSDGRSRPSVPDRPRPLDATAPGDGDDC